MELSATLAPLFDKTPLALERLRLVWRDLPALERADLISILLADSRNEPRALRWRHHRSQVIDLALADDCAYVRYLAARDVSEPDTRVSADSFSLVRLAKDESGWKFTARELKSPPEFWAMPQLERLVVINGLEESGERLANLLRYASKTLLPAASVTVEEMLDVLLQYLGGKTIAQRVADAQHYARRFWDGYAEYSAGESVKALWSVIPDVPKELAYVLLECLPPDAGFESDLAGSVLHALDENQLTHLLYRDDVPLKKLRRQLFRESTSDHLRDAAMSSFQFELEDSDITPLVYRLDESDDAGKKKVDQLAKLAGSCRGASLAQMGALCYLIYTAPSKFHSGLGKWDDAAFGRTHQTVRAKKLTRDGLEREIRQLRLFGLATNCTPLSEGSPVYGHLPDVFRGGDKLLVPGNPWETYLNLKSAYRDWKSVEPHLPAAHIEEFDIPEDLQPQDAEATDDSGDEKRQAFDLLNEVQEAVRDISAKDRAELSALGKALSQMSEQTERLETMLVHRVSALDSRTNKIGKTLNLVLWMSVGLVLFAIFKGGR